MDFNPEMEAFYMLFERGHTKNTIFRSNIQLDHPGTIDCDQEEVTLTHRIVVDHLLLVRCLVEKLLRDVAEPTEGGVERLFRPREVEHDERPVRVLVVHSGQASEPLVARNVPQLDVHQLFAYLKRENRVKVGRPGRENTFSDIAPAAQERDI